MVIHDNLTLSQSMHYCKADLKPKCDHKTNCKCKPIIITDWSLNSSKNTRKFKLDLYDAMGNPVRVQCIFGNTKGKARASGARAMLEVLT